MKDGYWRTLGWIADSTGDPEASISAQLRHLRKPRFGGHTVEREHLGNGLYQYRLVINPNAAEVMAAATKQSHHKVLNVGVGLPPETARPAPHGGK